MLPYSVTLTVPFPTEKQAVIAKRSLEPDPILKANELAVEYVADNSSLICKFTGVNDRALRVAISSVIDNLKTVVECMDEFEAV